MTDVDILAMLKANLELATSSFDTYLGQLIDVAYSAITREGITIEKEDPDDDTYEYSIDSIEDVNLIVMYAAYLYRKRADEGSPQMPRMLRYALNNRVFAEKMSEESTDDT